MKLTLVCHIGETVIRDVSGGRLNIGEVQTRAVDSFRSETAVRKHGDGVIQGTPPFDQGGRSKHEC